MALAEIGTVLSILEKLKNLIQGALSLLRSWRNRKVTPVESVGTRFVRVMESHGVHRNQIPRFFGQGLTLKDVQDDAALLTKLNEEILETVSARFAIRREWLDGAELQVHPCHDFYKDPEGFQSYIEDLTQKNPHGDMRGVLIAPDERDEEADALLILQEAVGQVGEKPIFRYHICNNWNFTYWKARAYLTACVAIAWKHNVYIHGIHKPKVTIERLGRGETLLGWNGGGIWELGHKTWHPEDLALRPDAFLDGVDPERDNFGVKSGLELWLDLDAQGLMDLGLGVNARPLFQNELANYP